MKIVCSLVLVSFINGIFANVMPVKSVQNRYYYADGRNMSAIDQVDDQQSFMLVGSERLFKIDVNDPLLTNSHYYLADGKSTALWLSPNALSTSPLYTLDYQAYGQGNSSFASGQFGYNGEYQDPETGLIDLRARDYDPSSQRFTTLDSYVMWNKYHFADANPISNIDPSGHSSETSHFFNQVGHFFKHYWPNIVMIAAGAFFVGSGVRETRSIESDFFELDPEAASRLVAQHVERDGLRSLETNYVKSFARVGSESGIYQYWYLSRERTLNAARVYKLGMGASLISAAGIWFKTDKRIFDPDHPGLGISSLFMLGASAAFGIALLNQYRYLRFFRSTTADSVIDGFQQNLARNLGINVEYVVKDIDRDGRMAIKVDDNGLP